ncbi:3-oxoadipate enol-lactonase [Devosia sp. MC532]|uniref:3-oxoadipate enol-lactonase n=1 Tax=Devosia sp. MC532 TaxID=2799788 RepID=UPI0018F567A6|nr:3-oxoadipate enol-lactonase [Devosia sp. MC532]MBJ7576508.1 3-oxoadipate enol-lactonase [Devosia sp. MC532]
MAFLERHSGALYYRLCGPKLGPALVLVNSLGTDCRIWDDVIGHLAQRYRVLSYDLRGHGLSAVPRGPYTLDDQVDDLLALVDHVGFDRFALCGVSIGGLISQGVVQRCAQRVDALILCNTAAKIGTEAFWNERMETVLAYGVEPIADAIMTRWFSPRFAQENTAAWNVWRRQFLQNSAQGYAATCATLRDADLTSALDHISVPTLVFAGSDDQATPPALVKASADRIADASYILLEHVGHLPSLEAPDQLSRHIQSFLEGHGHA